MDSHRQFMCNEFYQAQTVNRESGLYVLHGFPQHGWSPQVLTPISISLAPTPLILHYPTINGVLSSNFSR